MLHPCFYFNTFMDIFAAMLDILHLSVRLTDSDRFFSLRTVLNRPAQPKYVHRYLPMTVNIFSRIEHKIKKFTSGNSWKVICAVTFFIEKILHIYFNQKIVGCLLQDHIYSFSVTIKCLIDGLRLIVYWVLQGWPL
jgi:hypothetical protein